MSPLSWCAIGLALVVYLPVRPSLLFIVALCVSIVSAAIGVVLFDSRPVRSRRLGSRLAFFAAGLLIGCLLLVQGKQSRSFTGLPLSAVTGYEILLTDDSMRTRNGNILYRGLLLAVQGHDGTRAGARGTVLLTGNARPHDWGTRLRVIGAPRPGGELGSDWTGRVTAATVSVAQRPPWYFRVRSRSRGWVAGRLQRLRAEDAALFMALFLGAREDLGEAEAYFFRHAGAIHLLALSGFHLGILSVILVALATPFVGKVRAVVLAGVVLAAYLFVAGPKVSLIRAVLMFAFLGGCRLARIKARGVDLLCLTFLLSALTWPASLDTLSFQLSYLALAGILSLAPVVQKLSASWLPKTVRMPLAASIGAHIATVPVLVARFSLLYPVGLLSGLILTPLVTAFVWGGLAYLFLPLPGAIGAVAAELLAVIHFVLTAAAEFFARAHPVRIADPGFALLITACGILAVEMPALARLRARSCRLRERQARTANECGLTSMFALQSGTQMVYDSPKQLARFLDERGYSLKKRLGQNFLVSPGVREKILSLVETGQDRVLWEVGGGIGSLTQRLVDRVATLVVFEIDHGFVRVLQESFGNRPGVKIVEGDYLKTWQDALERFGRPATIVGNLPYRCAAPIIATLAEWDAPVSSALFTVQREVARRMAASPGTKEYSSFSLVCQSVFEVRLHGDIAPASFFPVPEVVSAIVSLVPNQIPRDYDRNLFSQVVRDLFAARRKTIRNNLLAGTTGRRFGMPTVDSALRRSSIDPADRGERLSVQQIINFVVALAGGTSADGTR